MHGHARRSPAPCARTGGSTCSPGSASAQRRPDGSTHRRARGTDMRRRQSRSGGPRRRRRSKAGAIGTSRKRNGSPTSSEAEHARDLDPERAPRWDEPDRWPDDREAIGALDGTATRSARYSGTSLRREHPGDTSRIGMTRETASPASRPLGRGRTRTAGPAGLSRGRRRREELWRPQGGQRGEPLRAARRGGRPAGPERRRQDHRVLHDHRPDQGRPRADRARRPRHHAACRCTSAGASASAIWPQEASIFRGLTVEQNIRAVLEVVEPNRKKREAELDALLEEFNITRLRKTPAIALSGGERRRVEIARALATPADLHAARRAVRRHRPDRGGRHPGAGAAPDPARHRRPDHRPQRARDAGPHRPRLHHLFGRGADGGPARRTSSTIRKCGGSISARNSACNGWCRRFCSSSTTSASSLHSAENHMIHNVAGVIRFRSWHQNTPQGVANDAIGTGRSR